MERGSTGDGSARPPAKKLGQAHAKTRGPAMKRAANGPLAGVGKARAARGKTDAAGVARTKRARRGERGHVSTESLVVGRAAGHVMEAWAPVRRCFVRRDAAGWDLLRKDELPPLARMLKSRGGEVRL